MIRLRDASVNEVNWMLVVPNIATATNRFVFIHRGIRISKDERRET
jgi:hypothetical protein